MGWFEAEKKTVQNEHKLLLNRKQIYSTCSASFLRDRSQCAIFSDCGCDSSYRNQWVTQDSMEVFTLCDCKNVTTFYIARYKQKQIAVTIRKKSHSVNEPIK